MKIWLDARRQPDVDWVWAKTAHCAAVLLRGGCVERISFAPDQPEIVEPIVEWLIDHDVEVRRAMHGRSARAKNYRKLLCIPAQIEPESAAS